MTQECYGILDIPRIPLEPTAQHTNVEDELVFYIF